MNIAERNIAKNTMNSNGNMIINNVFDIMNPPENNLNKAEIKEIISALEYIFQGNETFTIGKIIQKDIDRLEGTSSVKLNSWLRNEIHMKSISDLYVFEAETKRAFDQYYDWKNKYQSRKKALEKTSNINIKEETIVEKHSNTSKEEKKENTQQKLENLLEELNNIISPLNEVKDNKGKLNIPMLIKSTKSLTTKVTNINSIINDIINISLSSFKTDINNKEDKESSIEMLEEIEKFIV